MNNFLKSSTLIKNKDIWLIGQSTSVHILGSIITLVFTVICTRLLSTNEFGEIRYAMILLPIFMSFGLPGADGVILKYAYLKESVFLFPIYFIRMVGAGIGSILLCLWIEFFAGDQFGWTSALWAVVLLLPFYDIATGYKNFLIGRGLKKVALNLNFLVKVCSLLSVIALIFFVYFGVFPRGFLFPGYLICLIIPTTFIFFLVARSQRYSFYQNFSFRKFLSQSSLASLAGLISVFSVSLDKIYLGHYFGSSELAIYSILLMFPQEFSRLTDTFVPLYYDRFFYNKKKINLYLWASRLMPVIFFLFLVYGVTFYFLSPIVFGESYYYSLGDIILSLVFLCTCVGEYFSFHRVFAKYSLVWYLLFLIFGMMILYLFLIFLTPIYGSMGVLVAVILKQFLMTFILCFGVFDRIVLHRWVIGMSNPK